jgi:hypothetical protein
LISTLVLRQTVAVSLLPSLPRQTVANMEKPVIWVPRPTEPYFRGLMGAVSDACMPEVSGESQRVTT